MRVPDEFRDCVVYICVNVQTSQGIDMKLAGTGFWVSLHSDEINMDFSYLVTAKHVIEAIKQYTCDDKVYLRMNNIDAGAVFIRTNIEDWKYHPTNNTVDVAVVAGAPGKDGLQYKRIPLNMSLTPDRPIFSEFGAGDEVFLTGLFINHSGQNRNIPIIRTGNIAMMLEEPVQTKYGAAEAYLIESRSIGGLSGSPVFVYKPSVTVRDGTLQYNPNGSMVLWLGLIHGHWDIKPTLDSITDNTLSATSPTVNIGIAVVVPAHKVLEVINQPEYEEQRKSIIANFKQNVPDIDSSIQEFSQNTFVSIDEPEN